MKFALYFIPLILFYLYSTINFSHESADLYGQINSTSDTTIHRKLDSAPELVNYRGASYQERLKNYWSDNLKLKNGTSCSGNVMVQVVVEKDGSLSNPVILKGLEGSCKKANDDALRAIQSMPKFRPGQANGQVVRSYTVLIIRYPQS